MKANQIVRAWKDEDYRSSLSQSERSLMPGNPVGQVELSESDLHHVTGGFFVATRPVVLCGTSVVDSCVKPPQQCP